MDYPTGSKPRKVKDGDLVKTEDVPSRFSPPGVVLQDIPTLQTRFERLDETWGGYFPTILEGERASYEYPLPYESEEFWQVYAEPVQEFLGAAWVLRNALEWLGQWKANASDAKLARQGMNLINSLVACVSVIALPSPEGPIRQRWVSPSLLGSLAMMALQDLTELRRVLPCANCRRLFVTESYQRKFCSDRCRNTAQKQRWRAKKKEA